MKYVSISATSHKYGVKVRLENTVLSSSPSRVLALVDNSHNTTP